MKYISAEKAAAVDAYLMDPNGAGYTLPQLMELAGVSVATAIAKEYSAEKYGNVLVCIGPGNNGGDGLVAARHLAIWGYSVAVHYPKRKADGQHYYNALVRQLEACSVSWVEQPIDTSLYDLIVDAIFGFSFTGEARPPFRDLLDLITRSGKPTVSVDVPSGWDVVHGPESPCFMRPDMLVSLTAPKLCAQYYKGEHHYLGGRFLTSEMAKRLDLDHISCADACPVLRLLNQSPTCRE